MYQVKKRNQHKLKKFPKVLTKSSSECCYFEDIDFFSLCLKNPKYSNDNNQSSKSDLSMITPINAKPATSSTGNFMYLNTSVHNQSNSSNYNLQNSRNISDNNKQLHNIGQIRVNQSKNSKFRNSSANSSYRSNSNLNNKQPTVYSNELLKHNPFITNQGNSNKRSKISLIKCSVKGGNSTHLTPSDSKDNKNLRDNRRFNISSLQKSADLINESYLNSHLKKNENSSQKSRNLQEPKMSSHPISQSLQKNNNKFNYDIKVINNYNNNFNLRTNNIYVQKKRSCQSSLDYSQANGPEELHSIFVCLYQQKKQVYGDISNKLNLKYEGVLDDYLEYE